MYHVTGIGITAILLYSLSYVFYTNGFYTRSAHRKIWNILLAGAFIAAASAGIFIALQISYKWNIPSIKAILKWHVEFGTALAFTGLFHFLWHLTYFTRKIDIEADNNENFQTVRSARQNMINLFIAGFVSTSIQLLLMREIMNISGGYELITGIFLASWLMGSAAGSISAKRSRVTDLKRLNFIFGLNIIVSSVLMPLLGRLYLNPGETPSFFLSIIYTIIVVLPFTFVSGFIFIKILDISRQQNEIHAGSSFSIETTGGILSGIIISLIGYKFLNTYQILLAVIILFLSYFLLSFIFTEKIKRIIILSIALVFVCIVFWARPDRFFRELLIPGISVKVSDDTPYGNITSGEYRGEESIYYNHRLLRWHNDETEREENVHYAMLQSKKPENILVVSGDINSILGEIMKYNVRKVWYVERDPGLLKIYTSDTDLGNGSVASMINTDAYRFIKSTGEMFDVVLLVLPPPSTLMLNRFYTTDFFSALKGKLNPGGVFSCSPGAGENYFNRESTVLYSSVFNSLATVFKNVVPIVGNKLYYIASDDTISTSICSMVEKRGIKNTYVNSDFLSDDLILMKTSGFLSNVDKTIKPNTLAFPSACFHFQTFNLARTTTSLIPSLLLLIIIFFTPVFTLKKENIIMYFFAGALAGFEIIALIVLQSTAGNIYQLTGLIVAGLMAGLALGSGFGWPGTKKHLLLVNSLILILFYSVMALVVQRLLAIQVSIAGILLITLLTLIPSILTGQIFRVLTEISGSCSAASVYSADLAGSALAFIIVSAVTVPLIGIRNSLFLLAGIIFTGFLFGTIGNK